jgi:hypothetical protein
MICDVHPGFRHLGSGFFPHPGSRIHGSKSPGSGFATLVFMVFYIIYGTVGIFVDLCVLLGKNTAELSLEDVRDEAQHKLVSPNLASEPAFRVQDAEIDIVEIVSHAASTRCLSVQAHHVGASERRGHS